MASDIGLGVLGGVGGLGWALYHLLRQQRADALQEMRLREGEGTFEEVSAGQQPERPLGQRLFGQAPPGYYDLGGKLYKFQPYPELGEQGARALDLTYPETRTIAPMAPLTALDDTPAGYAIGRLPTPASITEEVPIPGAAEMRLGPKERLEILKDKARQRRDEAVANARTERTKLWLTRTPAGVARYEWLIRGLHSADDTTRTLAEAELSRLEAPARRADTAEARLDQAYTMHRERLQAAIDLLDTRLVAAKERNDARTQAALERQRERFQERLDEIDILEGGRNYRAELGGDVKLEIAGAPGTRAGVGGDMKVADALAKLKECRNKLYFPGNSSQALSTLEKVIGTLSQQERSHIGPTLTRRLLRLGEQLDRAERREGVRPQTPTTPPSTPGRQSSSSAGTGTSAPVVPRPQRALIQTYEDLYRRLSPEEAEADLNETLSDPVKRQSPMARAKISAYGNVYPQLPTETTLAPTTPPVPEGTPPAAAQAPAPPGQELPAPAPVPQPPQAAPRQAPQTPQAQALLDRFVAAYDPLSDQELDREEARLQRGGAGMDVLSQYRLKAIDTIRARRQGPGGPLDPRPSPTPSPRSADSPAPSTRGTARQPQGLGEHQRLVEEYRGLTPTELSAESRRVLRSDPLTRKSETNFRLTVLNQLLTERKAAKPHGELVDEPTLQRYRDEVREWSTARLLEESHTLRGVLGSGLQVLTQLRPEAFAGVTRAARLAREAAALGGAVASAPGATAGLPFLAPLAWGITLKSLSAAVPEAGTWLRDTYHRQLAIALELHERLRPKTGGTTTDEAAD